MSSAWGFYAVSVLVVFGIGVIACWALDMQLGTTGIMNFAFIVFQAAGAYTVAVLTLGSPASQSQYGQKYFWGTHLPFLVALIISAVVGMVLAGAIGLVVLRRIRADYQAIVMLAVSLIATEVIEASPGFLNGSTGLSYIPSAFQSGLSPLVREGWLYVAVVAAICLVCYFGVVRRLCSSPYGRALRATRENEEAAAALGKNTDLLKLSVFCVGGALAAISGGLFVAYLQAWAPGSWLYPETFVYITAVIVGGRGNKLGMVIGAFLVPLFGEVSQFLPPIGGPLVMGSLQWIATGLLIIVFLWFWPRGIAPEGRWVVPATRRMARDLVAARKGD